MTTIREGVESKMQEQDNLVNIDNYRKLIRTYMDLHDYNTALFWADKVLALSAGEPRDVYLIAQCMYMLKEFHRAAEFIKNRELDKSHILCHYLAVRSLVEAREYQEAMNLLNIVDQENSLNGSCVGDTESVLDENSKFNVQGALHLLRGRVLEALDNRALASECYRLALQSDVHCFEAFNALVQHQMLTALEERQLLDSLPFSQQCDETEIKILRNIYEGFLKKFHANNSTDVLSSNKQNLNDDKEMRNTFTELRKICGKKLVVKTTQSKSNFNTSVHVSLLQNQSLVAHPHQNKMLNAVKNSFDNKTISPANIKGSNRTNINDNSARGDGSNSASIVQSENTSGVPYEIGLKRLEQSYDVIVSKAEKYFYNCEYKQCLALTDGILRKDPFHNGCLKVHISCLVEMCNYNKLFYLAHKLVDLYPEKAMSWYAVGCYYYVIGKSDPARRYLAKATSIDRLLGPAWLAYGHSFAVENEHDQAMAAYFKASQLMRGCHLPMLYIGLECGLTNNNKLADKFFQQAEKIAPNDPFVIHEMGVIAYHNHDYETAEKYFRDALSKITTASCKVSDCWEALLNNLGHTCRRNGNFEEAVEFHKRALVLDPQNPSTYSAIGFVQALKGDTSEAVDSFHKALSLRRDDTFSTTMLSLTVEQLMEEALVIPDEESNLHLRHSSVDLIRKRGEIRTANPLWANSSNRVESLEISNIVDISSNPAPVNETCFEDMSMSMDE